jgi:hypothetical protein
MVDIRVEPTAMMVISHRCFLSKCRSISNAPANNKKPSMPFNNSKLKFNPSNDCLMDSATSLPENLINTISNSDITTEPDVIAMVVCNLSKYSLAKARNIDTADKKQRKYHAFKLCSKCKVLRRFSNWHNALSCVTLILQKRQHKNIHIEAQAYTLISTRQIKYNISESNYSALIPSKASKLNTPKRQYRDIKIMLLNEKS